MPIAWLAPLEIAPPVPKTSWPVAVVRPVMLASDSVTAQSQRPEAPAKFLVNVSVSVWGTPSESLTLNVPTYWVPSACEASRLPPKSACVVALAAWVERSEEHTSELQSPY